MPGREGAAMKPIAALPHEGYVRKPPHGSPCNRCGLCCMATICNLGQHVFSRAEYPGPCPALEKVGDEYVCGLVAQPRAFRQQAKNNGQGPRHIALGRASPHRLWQWLR